MSYNHKDPTCQRSNRLLPMARTQAEQMCTFNVTRLNTEKEDFQKLSHKLYACKVHELPAMKHFGADFHLKVWIEVGPMYPLIQASFFGVGVVVVWMSGEDLAKIQFPLSLLICCPPLLGLLLLELLALSKLFLFFLLEFCSIINTF